MAIFAALIGVIGGGLLNKSGSDKNKKGNKKAAAELENTKSEVGKTLGPYSTTGDASLYRLASLMGIEGYRTESEAAYTKFLASKPELGAVDPSIADRKGFKGFLDKQERNSTLGDQFGGVTSYYGKQNRKKARTIAAAQAQAAAQHKESTATWQIEADRLKGDSDKSLVGYDPGKARSDYLRSTPGYNFRFDEGVRAIDASGSSKGDLLSGQGQKRLTEFGQGIASQEYGNEFSRLLQMSGIGLNAATIKANTAVGAGNQLANLSSLQGRQDQQTTSNYNDLLQGGVRDYSYLSGRQNNNRGTSFNSNTYDISPASDSINDFNTSSQEVLGRY